jgi:hypothetical protein
MGVKVGDKVVLREYPPGINGFCWVSKDKSRIGKIYEVFDIIDKRGIRVFTDSDRTSWPDGYYAIVPKLGDSVVLLAYPNSLGYPNEANDYVGEIATIRRIEGHDALIDIAGKRIQGYGWPLAYCSLDLNLAITPSPTPTPTPTPKHSHYFKSVEGLKFIDVYRVLQLFGVTDPCIQHAVKKLLVAGGRGAGKDTNRDIQESIDTLVRWQEMQTEGVGKC